MRPPANPVMATLPWPSTATEFAPPLPLPDAGKLRSHNVRPVAPAFLTVRATVPPATVVVPATTTSPARSTAMAVAISAAPES